MCPAARDPGRDVPRRSGAARAPRPEPETRFVEGSGRRSTRSRPTTIRTGSSIDKLVQQEPAGAGDPETLGLLASVGIVKGKPFDPDDRMRKILDEAVVVGNATARTVSFAPREEEGWAYYPGSAVVQHALRRRLRVP